MGASLGLSKARATMGPRTAYSTFFTVGFMVSMVNTLVRGGTLFSDIFSLGSPRRVALRPDSALPGEEDDRGGEVMSARSPEPPGSDSFRTGFRSRRFLGDSHCIRVADMLRRLFSRQIALERLMGESKDKVFIVASLRPLLWGHRHSLLLREVACRAEDVEELEELPASGLGGRRRVTGLRVSGGPQEGDRATRVSVDEKNRQHIRTKGYGCRQASSESFHEGCPETTHRPTLGFVQGRGRAAQHAHVCPGEQLEAKQAVGHGGASLGKEHRVIARGRARGREGAHQSRDEHDLLRRETPPLLSGGSYPPVDDEAAELALCGLSEAIHGLLEKGGVWRQQRIGTVRQVTQDALLPLLQQLIDEGEARPQVPLQPLDILGAGQLVLAQHQHHAAPHVLQEALQSDLLHFAAAAAACTAVSTSTHSDEHHAVLEHSPHHLTPTFSLAGGQQCSLAGPEHVDPVQGADD
ncbi:hypothetical protein EYF80_022289 [Liparis tanakae]|uniref:Uncharacterized protein n=1 Tax=Liparis tanakae TaxID=230148 RepID=A0A4Z2HR49_9TELE|nr:hypothetical protein EYF80_022289 [Liparis tanakae]